MWLKARERKTGARAARGVLVEGCDHPLDPVLGFDPPSLVVRVSLPFVALPLLESQISKKK